MGGNGAARGRGARLDGGGAPRRQPLGQRERAAPTARHRLREVGLDAPHAQSQILPVRIGDSARTVELMQQLLEDGVYVAAIRPPTVPKGTSRLRFSVMASHSPRQLDRAVEALTRRCS